MAERRLNVTHHVRKIVALSEIYGQEAAARAIADALEFGAFSCEYIANLLEQRKRLVPEAGALHLTRRADLLELELPEPDLGLYATDRRESDSNATVVNATDLPAADPHAANPPSADPSNPAGDPHEPGQDR
jgi:hypothetical protein